MDWVESSRLGSRCLVVGWSPSTGRGARRWDETSALWWLGWFMRVKPCVKQQHWLACECSFWAASSRSGCQCLVVGRVETSCLGLGICEYLILLEHLHMGAGADWVSTRWILHFMICHSKQCHWAHTSSLYKQQRGGIEYGLLQGRYLPSCIASCRAWGSGSHGMILDGWASKVQGCNFAVWTRLQHDMGGLAIEMIGGGLGAATPQFFVCLFDTICWLLVCISGYPMMVGVMWGVLHGPGAVQWSMLYVWVAGWSRARVLHGPEGCAVVPLNMADIYLATSY